MYLWYIHVWYIYRIYSIQSPEHHKLLHLQVQTYRDQRLEQPESLSNQAARWGCRRLGIPIKRSSEDPGICGDHLPQLHERALDKFALQPSLFEDRCHGKGGHMWAALDGRARHGNANWRIQSSREPSLSYFRHFLLPQVHPNHQAAQHQAAWTFD